MLTRQANCLQTACLPAKCLSVSSLQKGTERRCYFMFRTLCEIVISILAVYGGYTVLRDLKKTVFEVLEKRRKDD